MKLTGFCGPSYTSISRAINAQRCINLRLEVDLSNGKVPVSLIGMPGYEVVKQNLPVEEVRAFWMAQGRTFVVVGAKLYELYEDLTHVERGTFGTDKGPVILADNGLQMLGVDGAGVLALVLESNVTYNSITNFPPGATFVACVDNTMIANEAGTQRFAISAVGDALTWRAIDFASVEGMPDDIVSFIAFNRQIYFLGETSLQVFWNSGDPTRPFIPLEGSASEIGCIAPYSVAKDEAGIYFLGADDRGGPRVYKAVAGRAGAISTPAMDAAFVGSNKEPAYVLDDARGYTFRMDGHVFYVLTFPSSDKTWVFDATTEGWCEFLEWDTRWRRHRGACAIHAFGRQLIGDFENGKLYELSSNTYHNGGAVQRALRTGTHVSQEQRQLTVGSLEIVTERAVGLQVGQGGNPQMMMRVSKDGGFTWPITRMRTMGVAGNTKTRTRFSSCGTARDFVFEISISDPVKRVIVDAIINED